jgi:hypothetical protein
LTEINPLALWIALQVALEAILVVLMVVFLLKLKKLGRETKPSIPTADLAAVMDRFVKESQRLSDSFTETLNRKKDLSVQLILRIEDKIQEMKRLLERAESGLAKAAFHPPPYEEEEKANPAAPENRALVLRLARQGHGAEEIARRTKLIRGEVELILDLEKKFSG